MTFVQSNQLYLNCISSVIQDLTHWCMVYAQPLEGMNCQILRDV